MSIYVFVEDIAQTCSPTSCKVSGAIKLESLARDYRDSHTCQHRVTRRDIMFRETGISRTPEGSRTTVRLLPCLRDLACLAPIFRHSGPRERRDTLAHKDGAAGM